MTENEAKEWIEYLGNKNLPYDRSPISRKLACDMAIQALEEIQAYRAIGTVEELQDVYELCESLEEAVKVGNALVEELKKYHSIGTIDEFKALKEKNEPKKAIGKRKYDEAYCPACNEVISDGEFWALDEYVHHCNYCGQAVKSVDWQ